MQGSLGHYDDTPAHVLQLSGQCALLYDLFLQENVGLLCKTSMACAACAGISSFRLCKGAWHCLAPATKKAPVSGKYELLCRARWDIIMTPLSYLAVERALCSIMRSIPRETQVCCAGLLTLSCADINRFQPEQKGATEIGRAHV